MKNKIKTRTQRQINTRKYEEEATRFTSRLQENNTCFQTLQNEEDKDLVTTNTPKLLQELTVVIRERNVTGASQPYDKNSNFRRRVNYFISAAVNIQSCQNETICFLEIEEKRECE